MLVFPLLIQHKCFKLLCIYNYKTVSTGIKADTMFTVMYRMTQQNPNFIRSVLFLFYILSQNAIELWAKNKLTVIFCWHLHTRRFIFSCSCSSSFSSSRDGSWSSPTIWPCPKHPLLWTQRFMIRVWTSEFELFEPQLYNDCPGDC